MPAPRAVPSVSSDLPVLRDPAGLPTLPPIAEPGQPWQAIDTPALVLVLDAFERNLQRMQQAADRAGVALRPHAKAHKCPDIALAQMTRGAVGICCQKVSEALPFLRAGVADIHISNEIAGPAKATLLARMARHARISVCVDAVVQVRALAEAAEREQSGMTVLVELDIGQGRCGVADADAALRLAERIAAQPRLSFGGLQAYHGGIQHVRDHAARREAAARAAERAGAVAARLAAAGAPCQVVTGGGSGSVEFDLASGVFTEIQPGSYVFMDGDYGSNEGVAASGTGGGIGGGIDGGGAAEALRFEHSLFIATTVMSTAAQGQVVVDAGLKSMAVDSGLPWVWERNTGERNAGERHGGQFGGGRRSTRLAYVAANDEHGIVRPVPAAGGELPALPQLGEPLWLVPGHCDPTLNLYDTLVGVRDGKVESLWPISARGLSR